MKTLILLISFLPIAIGSAGQTKSGKFIVDNEKKFYYSDTGGITQSYIEHFGSEFRVPKFQTIEGKKFSSASLKGKTVVYNFWFVACKPCVAEMPALNRLARAFPSDSVQFVGITFDNEARIKEFLTKNEFVFQITSLPQSEINKFKKFSYYPITCIVTREGRLSFVFFGKPKGRDPQEKLFELLQKQVAKAMLAP